MKRFVLFALLPLTLAACSHSPSKETAVNDTMDASILNAYYWQLTDARNANGQLIDPLFVQKDKPVRLEFHDDNFAVANTCNNMGGRYSVEGNQIKFHSIASTMMMCANTKIAKLDQEVSHRLEKTKTFNLQPTQQPESPRLTLSTTAGDMLTFTGKMTPETRYGNPGEIVFLEIAPQLHPCSHPLIPNMQCMQVRRVYFDENGLKSLPSPQWENFYQTIDGYDHQNGVRNVVRVKRYRIVDAPADAPDTAYVLDMVVESELVKP